MIRVLQVLATLKRAGAEALVTSLVCHIDRERFDPAVVTLYDASPGDLEETVRACGIPVRRLGKSPGLDLRMYPAMKKAIREFQPDLIHTHSYVMRYVLPVAPCPVVHTVHNLAGQEVDRIGQLIHRIGFRRGVVPVAVADEVARSFHRLYGFPPAATIANGIDLSRFGTTDRNEWRRREDFSPDHVLIVSAARLEPQKNPALLAGAFRRLPQHCHLLLAGEGSLRGQLTGLDRVHLAGSRSDLPDMLQSCDIFALASDWEGHPIALMEAMAAGLPIVATSVGGVPEILGDAGMLVPRGDEDALASALLRLAGDADERQRLGRAARERAGQFDVRNTVRAYEAVYAQAVRR